MQKGLKSFRMNHSYYTRDRDGSKEISVKFSFTCYFKHCINILLISIQRCNTFNNWIYDIDINIGRLWFTLYLFETQSHKDIPKYYRPDGYIPPGLFHISIHDTKRGFPAKLYIHKKYFSIYI